MSKPTRVPITEFAPAKRVSIDIIHCQAAALDPLPLPDALLNSASNYVLILNEQRQIVFASQSLRELSQGKARDRLLGLRLGEALECVHAQEPDGGCGTTRFCENCGALQAIRSSLAGTPDACEYRLTRLIGCRKEALHLFVISKPLTHGGELFSIVALTNGGDAESRRGLERLFAESPQQPLAKPRAKARGTHSGRGHPR